MVVGLDKFEEHFKEFSDCFVIIGGTACSILFEEMDLQFRATKDLDVVLIQEDLKSDFSDVFWDFIQQGKYASMEKNLEKMSYYRFKNPGTPGFPLMIELFTRKPVTLELWKDQIIIPIKFEEAKSLSAIILDDNYYKCLRDGIRSIKKLNYLDTEFVVLFKMKAYLDLVEREQRGEEVDSKNIKKHRNDVFRLLQIVTEGKKVRISAIIHSDVFDFLGRVQNDPPDLKALKTELTLDEAIKIIGDIFVVGDDKEG